jgi:AraC-like DNA-binding protein
MRGGGERQERTRSVAARGACALRATPIEPEHARMQTEVFALVDGGAEEVRRDASYRWDNARRGGPNRMDVQRTLSGAAYFEDAKGRRLVPAGWAMLFTHREPTRYGFPVGTTQPYRHRYLSLAPGTSVIPVFARIRTDFGSVVRMGADGEAAGLFEEIFRRLRDRSFVDRFHESELIYRMLVAIYREQAEGARHEDPVEFGRHLLVHGFRSPLNLKTVARRCGVSREHFMRAFRERFGEPPGELLRRLRLEHARTMLTATGMAVGAVARASGFTSSTVFCRAFRRAYGSTPAEVRRGDVAANEAPFSSP